jgi:3-deoxy-D-manno-octulosonate 8-phosphate phosphatase (KDO 8-P phosphatase)
VRRLDFSKIELLVFDFDGVFTDNAVWIDQNGIEMVRCSRADGIGLSKLRSMGVDMIVVSTEENPIVSMRCKKLKLDCRQGIKNKFDEVVAIAKRKKKALLEIAFVGNDINDFEVMNKVGFPIAVADAEPEIKKIARYISKRLGGAGAVREICELIAADKTSSNYKDARKVCHVSS